MEITIDVRFLLYFISYFYQEVLIDIYIYCARCYIYIYRCYHFSFVFSCIRPCWPESNPRDNSIACGGLFSDGSMKGMEKSRDTLFYIIVDECIFIKGTCLCGGLSSDTSKKEMKSRNTRLGTLAFYNIVGEYVIIKDH